MIPLYGNIDFSLLKAFFIVTLIEDHAFYIKASLIDYSKYIWSTEVLYCGLFLFYFILNKLSQKLLKKTAKIAIYIHARSESCICSDEK